MSILWHLMTLDPYERLAVDHGPIPWPRGCDLPEGWRWGAFVAGSTWWAVHTDGGVAIVETRDDLDDADGDDMLDAFELCEGYR